ncbi:hypothetical protein H5993_06965 [Lactobacillus alvi]|uniref:Polymerase n=1 Tax=Limosilactobacillus alvi TaxID=990412 RepID=A0ABS2EQ30_9LACO|nr:hypothetical protein [Limosilactobacillus alvi]MBM6754495.1 hypothetical protein [Limosilactobacillus alvi]
MGKVIEKWHRIEEFKLNGEFLYQVAFILILSVSFLQTSTYTDFFVPSTLHRWLFVGLGLIYFKIFFLDRHSFKTICGNLIVLAYLFITWRSSNDFMIVVMGSLILGMRNVNFRQIIRLYLVVGTISLVGIFIDAELGIIRNIVFVRDTTNAVRQSFGIIYSTDFAAHVLYLVLAHCYLAFRRLKWYHYLSYLLLAIFVSLTTDARLDALAIVLTIPVAWIGKRAADGHLGSRLVAGFYWILPILGAYLTIWSAYFYTPGNHILVKLNHLISGRLLYGRVAFDRYPLSLFGQKIHENGWGASLGPMTKDLDHYFFIDSSYLRLLIIFGITALLATLVIMTKLSWKSIQSNDYALASIMVIIMISAVLEQRLIDIAYDPFLLALLAKQSSLKIKEKNFERVHC